MRLFLRFVQYVGVAGLSLITCTCNSSSKENRQTGKRYIRPVDANAAYLLHKGLQEVTDVVIYDIFSPPVASRIYAYTALAAYEATRWADTAKYPSLTARLRGFDAMPVPATNISRAAALAGLKAMLTVARKVTFSHDSLNRCEKEMTEAVAQSGLPEETLTQALDFGEAIGQAILSRAAKDNYKESRGYPKYNVTPREEVWNPTPPDYADALEPYWYTIATLALDSASQYKPPRPIPYNKQKNSAYFKEVQDVFEVNKNLTEEQKEIAFFWDDNPFVSHHKGHVVFNSKKMTPGGHWMMIASQIARNTHADAPTTAKTFALVSIALFDGFISCWEEKFDSKMVRPITVINRYIDERWEPFLQTPPFPEYTSGHSVISAAAAEVMTTLYGDNFAYHDSTEVPYGRPVRSFRSFRQAAEECSISRLYGGIHYRHTLKISNAQGKKVGQWVLLRTQTNPIVLQ
ncbi:MAG: vanadium-dependent haloperoxidase [Cytophagales bacterium]|nr:vanadium-dependent haloperoxidase [Bernardetiaceae bacterium]MDW8204001.1 vanadium-dependent haloperoxidase [Cytophagales bacterium]